MPHGTSPALHLLKKTLYSPCDEARAVARAARAIAFTGEIAPVIFGQRHLGTLLDRHGRVFYTPEDAIGLAGFPNGYTDVITATQLGQKWVQPFGFTLNSAKGFAWSDCWNVGFTLAQAYSGTALTARQFTDASVGAIPHGGNVSTYQKYLSQLFIEAGAANGANGPVLWLYDRVLSYDECTYTSSSMTNTLTAQRWVGSGLPGLRCAVTASQTSTGATASSLTAMSYTDEGGTAGSAMPNSQGITFDAASVDPSATIPNQIMSYDTTDNYSLGPFLPLAPGDIGVSSIQSYTFSAVNTGTLCFALVRPLAMFVCPDQGLGMTVDCWRDKFSPSRILDGSCLNFLVWLSSQGNMTLAGTLGVGVELDVALIGINDMIAKATASTPKQFSIYIQKPTYTSGQGGTTWLDLWPIATGDCDGGAYPGTASTAYALSSTDVGIPPVGPALVGSEGRYITSMEVAAGDGPGIAFIYDRVLLYSSIPITATTVTMTNSVTAPRYTTAASGGMQLMICAQNVFSGDTFVTGYSYVNQAGVTQTITGVSYKIFGLTSTPGPTTAGFANGNAAIYTPLPWLPLAPGDIGVTSLLSVTMNTAVTGGLLSAVLVKPIAMISTQVSERNFSIDTVRQYMGGFNSVPDGACLSLFTAAWNDASQSKMNWGVHIHTLRG